MNQLRSLFAFLSFVFCLTLISSLISCGGKEPKPEPDWAFKPQSIEIAIHADVMLNEFNESSHALQLVIYQFDTINKFMELAEYKDGLKKMLKAQNFDPSVQAVKKIFVDPGETKKIRLDRAEKARWVGVVAGYFNLIPGRTTNFFEIPYNIEKQGMIFFRKEVAVISDLKINLTLKEHELKGMLLDE